MSTISLCAAQGKHFTVCPEGEKKPIHCQGLVELSEGFAKFRDPEGNLHAVGGNVHVREEK